MAKKAKTQAPVSETTEAQRKIRCELCFKPIIDDVHENGVCRYEILAELLKKKGGIIIMA